MTDDMTGPKTTITDAMRYRWLITNCVEVSRDNDGEEISYFLHFDDTEDFEAVEGAIDRHIRSGSTENLS